MDASAGLITVGRAQPAFPADPVLGGAAAGDFYVTMMVYRDYRLVTNRPREAGISPIMVGPLYVHRRKDEATHRPALATLATLEPRLRAQVRLVRLYR